MYEDDAKIRVRNFNEWTNIASIANSSISRDSPFYQLKFHVLELA